MAKVRCYLQLKVDATRKPQAGWALDRVVAIAMTQNPPRDLAPNANYVVEVNLEIPDRLLLPIEANAMIPELQLQAEFEATLRELGDGA